MITGEIMTRAMQITDLCPAAYNPRVDLQPGDPEYEKLQRSMEQYGYVEPIIYNEQTGTVVGGHQRLKILAANGVETVQCVVVNLDLNSEKALNVALNKVSGAWDFEKLADVMRELTEQAVDATLTGFDQTEIDDLIAEMSDVDVDSFFSEPTEKTQAIKKVTCPDCGCEFEP